MANVPSPLHPRIRTRRRTSVSFIIILGLSLALMLVGSDVVLLVLRPLDQLAIPYPHVFRVTHFLLPVTVFVVWFVGRRSVVATGVALVLAFFVMTRVTDWADSQVARIPVTRWMEATELAAAEQRLGFKITETGGKYGNFVLVARGNEQAAADEAKRLGCYRP